MKYKLKDKLDLDMDVIAIFFTDSKPEMAQQFKEGKRGCVASMLINSAKNLTVALFDEKTYGCPGGGVGLCFGDTFTSNNHPTEQLLSTGVGFSEKTKNIPNMLKYGERFFATPELVSKWKSELPYYDMGKKYVVFKPLSKLEENEIPDLVCMFVNPDQLSALIIMSGFFRGAALNTIAPFGAACHSILFARNEMKKEKPNGVIGFFDLAQRSQISKDILSFTVPYKMYTELENGIEEGCLTTESWEKIKGR